MVSNDEVGREPNGRSKPPIVQAGREVSPAQETPVDGLRKQVHALQLALDAAVGEISALRKSTSWRVTRPIRVLKRMFTGGTPGSRIAEQSEPDAVAEWLPPEIRKFHDSPPAQSNETFRLVNADVAMEPVLAMANARRPGIDAARIAFLGSDELDSELRFDAHVTRMRQVDWRAGLKPGALDYLLVETVWHGGSSGWRSALLADGSAADEVRQLVDHCRQISLPVVVWFRGEESSYRQFAWLGELGDRLYAINEDLLVHLMRDYPSKSGLLGSYIQPALHNPVRSQALQNASQRFSNQVLYDGWWDVAGGHVELSRLLGIASQLRICESEWEFGGVRLRDDPEVRELTLGCVDPVGKGALDRLAALEIFSDGSLRSGWRRSQAMLRAAACGSVPIDCDMSGRGRAGIARGGAGQLAREFVESMLGDPLARMTIAHRMRRQLLSSHCLADRLDTVSRDLGVPGGRVGPPPPVAMILVTMRPELLEACLQRFRADVYPNRELIVVLHGQLDAAQARNLVRPGEAIRMFAMPRSHSLGACLNMAISMTDAAYWTKVDDDDLYGPNYLLDIMLARRLADFDVAGKPPMFAYLDEGDRLYWDPVWANHSWLLHSHDEATSALVAGGTITCRRGVVERVPFSEKRRGGSDSEFIRCCYEAGLDVLAMDGFNFARYRSSRAGFHTWRHDHSELDDRAVRIGGIAQVAERVFI